MRRLKASLAGTNLELTGDYNQRLVYQAIRTRGPITRNALIALTGLAKPTVAGIVRRLIGSDLVHETSRIYGGRGQPAVHLEINPAGCYAIGLRIGEHQLSLVSVDALGNVVGHTTTASPQDGRVEDLLRREVSDLTRDLRRDRIIGLGVTTSEPSGSAGDGAGIHGPALAEIAPGVPIYIDTDLAAATAGESLFGLGEGFQSYYYMLMDVRPVGGLVLHQSLYRGAHARQRRWLFPDAELGWCREAVTAELEARAAERAPAECDERWLSAACEDLLPLLVSINCILNPGAVLIGGGFPQSWLERLARRCDDLLPARAPQIPSHAGVRPARLAADAALVGAASLPMRARLFPTGEALLKAPGHAG